MVVPVPLIAWPCHLLYVRSEPARSGWGEALSAHAMLRIHGNRDSLLAVLTAHWAEQQLQILTSLRPVVRPIRQQPRGVR